MTSAVDQAPESFDNAKEAEPKSVDEEVRQDANLESETILPTEFVKAAPSVEDSEMETSTSHIEANKEGATDGATSVLESDGAIPAEPAREPMESWEIVSNDGLDSEENLGGGGTPTTDSAHAFHSVEDKSVEARSPEHSKGEATDEIAQYPVIEAIVGEDVKDREPVADNEKDNYEENVAEEKPLTTDSAKAIPRVQGEDLEAPTSHEQLAKEVTSGDEPSPSPESAATTAVEDTKDEGPVEVEEAVNTDIGTTPLVEDKGVEASTLKEDLAKEENASGATQSPTSGTATLVEVAEVGELNTGEEGANKGEHAADGLPLPTHSPDPISDIEDKEFEAPTNHDELAQEDTTGEVAQNLESGEATLVEESKDGEPMMGDKGSNNYVTVADEKLLSKDFADAIPTVEDRDLEALTSHEAIAKAEAAPDDSGLALRSGETNSATEDDVVEASAPQEEHPKEETTDEVAQPTESFEAVSEDAKEAEPVDEDTNNEQSITVDKDVETPIAREGPAEEETVDNVDQSVESTEVTFPGDVEDREHLIDEKEESGDSISDGTIAMETDKNVELGASPKELSTESDKIEEMPTSHEESSAENMATNDVASTPESSGTTLVVENGAQATPFGQDDKIKDLPSADEEHAKDQEVVGQEISPTSDSTDGDKQEEPTKEDTATQELAVTPETVEEIGTEGIDVEPAVVGEELPKENVVEDVQSKEKSPETTTLEQDEVSSSARAAASPTAVEGVAPPSTKPEEADTDVVNTKLEPATSVEANSVPDEKDVASCVESEGITMDQGSGDKLLGEANAVDRDEDLKSVAPRGDTVPNDSESALGSTEVTTVDNAEVGNHDEDSESDVNYADKTLDELASPPGSSEVTPTETPTENAETVNRDEGSKLAAPDEDIRPKELAPAPESIDVTPAEDTETVNHHDREPVTVEKEESEDFNSAAKDKDVDASTIHEELSNEETTDEETRSKESSEAPLVESAKEEEPLSVYEDLNKPPSIPEGVDLTTNSPDIIPAAEEKNVENSTSYEDFVKEEKTGDVSQSPESDEATNVIPAIEGKDVETPTSQEEPSKKETATEHLTSTSERDLAFPAEDAKDVELATADKGLEKEQSTAEDQAGDVSQSLESIEATHVIPPIEGEDVETPTQQEEPIKEETVTGHLNSYSENGMAIPAEDAKDVELATTDEDLENEQSTAKEQASTTESSTMTRVVEDKGVGAPFESAHVPESVVSPNLEGTDAEHVPPIENKDVEVPASHKQLAQEDAITRELPSAPESPLDPVSKGFEEENSLVREISSRTDSREPVGVVEAKDEESPSQSEEPDKLNPLTEELTSSSEVAKATVVEGGADADLPKDNVLHGMSSISSLGAASNTEDKDVESPTAVQVPEELAGVDEVPFDTKSAEAAVTEADKHHEPATNDNELMSSDAAYARKELPDEEIVANTTDLEEEPANMSEMVAKAARDLDPGFLQELQDKFQNVAEDPDDDQASVPLSTHTADLSSSWVSVSPIRSVEAQSVSDGSQLNLSQRSRSVGSDDGLASDGSQLNLSQRSRSGGPDDDLPSGGDSWRIVSEHGISALDGSKSRTQDGDTGSSGTKFPFSIILWCTQSMTTLFGGSQK